MDDAFMDRMADAIERIIDVTMKCDLLWGSNTYTIALLRLDSRNGPGIYGLSLSSWISTAKNASVLKNSVYHVETRNGASSQ